ncbi:hypothetical protein [Streptomyces sp. NPDC004728]|uniref:hypothetical protein n=1 Tax=Streptomyces sp. NPDC004728 TaxID=3154289 RepID=UPI0033BA3D80
MDRDGDSTRFVSADTDPWGSVIAMHDGNETTSIAFMPYGHPDRTDGSVIFHGMRRDPYSGLYIRPAGRPYDPLVGRWLTPTAGATGNDPYVYKNNNPFRKAG